MKKTVCIEFTQDDLNTVSMLFDAGVKSLGLVCVKPAATLLAKLEAAIASANNLQSQEAE